MAHIEHVPLKDRVDATVVIVLSQRDWYLADKGHPDFAAIADALTDLVVEAVAETPSERRDVALTRRVLMQQMFPEVADQDGWAAEPDPDLAEGVYDSLDAMLWRMLDMNPRGRVQSRLRDDHEGMVLCRTRTGTKKPYDVPAVYVTRARELLFDDAIEPMHKRQMREHERDGAMAVMLMERVPEHAKVFEKALMSGLRQATNRAKGITTETLERLEARTGADDSFETSDDGSE